jgi:putative ABC transport system ATP-binding protein
MFRQIARDKGSAVICVTHDQRMIEGFDRIYRVNDGRVTDGNALDHAPATAEQH